jgi:hypothetical protein
MGAENRLSTGLSTGLSTPRGLMVTDVYGCNATPRVRARERFRVIARFFRPRVYSIAVTPVDMSYIKGLAVDRPVDNRPIPVDRLERACTPRP